MNAMNPPDIANNSLPADERDDAAYLNLLFGKLRLFSDRFSDALLLFDEMFARWETEQAHGVQELAVLPSGGDGMPIEECAAFLEASNASTKAHRWCELAARDAAWSVYHFHGILEAISVAVRETCRTLRPFMRLDEIDAASGLLRSLFPRLTILRNGLGHSGENYRTRERALRNLVKLRDGTPLGALEGQLTFGGRIFMISTAGEKGAPPIGYMARLEISEESLAKLRRVEALVFAAAQPAADFSNSLPRPAKQVGACTERS
jgi:hypothetical protein